MSYDIYLADPATGERIHFDEPHDITGGTYCLGGTTEAWLNITYNYWPFFRADPCGWRKRDELRRRAGG